jgi:hypothetical protein
MTKTWARFIVAIAVAAGVVLPAQQALAFSDVPSGYWDYAAITYVASTHTWMQDYGPDTFRPTTRENRSFLARTLVKMYAPNEPIDPKITFSDLPNTDPMYPFANVAVKLNWIAKYTGERWAGGSAVPRNLFDQALITAMKLTDPVNGLANIKMDNGTKYPVDSRWPHMQLASFLRLHYNHSDETMDLQIRSLITRDEVAYSLYTAWNLASWQIQSTGIFDKVSLPTLDPKNPAQNAQYLLTQYSLLWVGYPYIWAGEWNAVSPPDYCCGYQPQGGFDCSGYVWWVLKKYEDGYNAAQYRSYAGWSVHERSSSAMAGAANPRIPYASLAVGNLMFFSSNGGQDPKDVDHVGIYVGNGWMMHSTSGGPQLQYVATGWYHDHFVFGRGLKAYSGPEHIPPSVASQGDPDVGPTA